MKNLKLGVKLIGGFTLTALIVLIVGVIAIYEQGKLHHQVEVVGKESLPGVEHILSIKAEANKIAGLMRTLLTPYATKEQREHSHQELLNTRKIYGAAKKEFVELPIMSEIEEEWSNFNTNIGKWVTVNNKAVELSKELIKTDMADASQLKEHMLEFGSTHHALLAKLGKMVTFEIPFEGGTDHTACSLGKWLQNPNTDNHDLKTLVTKLHPVHLELHSKVSEVKKLHGNGDTYGAKNVLLNHVFPLSEDVFSAVAEMEKLTDTAYSAFDQMNDLLLLQAADHQANTLDALDAIVEKVEGQATSQLTEAKSIASAGKTINIVGMIIGIALAVALGSFLTLIITRPIAKGVDLSKSMAEGDMTRTMDVDQNDEIGVLAKSLNGMAKSLKNMITDVNTEVDNVDGNSQQLASIANQMEGEAGLTAGKSNQVSTAAEEMSSNQESVAASMEQASINVTMVASAAEEMNVTISEIAINSSKAKDITTQAVNHSEIASDRVNELGRAADEINKVTETITEISEQTNLLALNATIEAARAGDAGKGFAVVANEIKDLAKQTAEATLDIKTKIEGIQEATGITVKEINEISTVISDVDQIVATIAAAVEEQTATTKEIAENISQVSAGISEVNENVSQSSIVAGEIAADISDVNNSANEMQAASTKVTESAKQLAQIAEKLKTMMEAFTV